MFQRQGGAAYKVDLSRTIALCNYLDNPEKGLRCIHVAGTNGKGSVSHMWAATLQNHGYKTGLFTSPHLKDFRERIRINGTPVSEQSVVNWVEKHENYLIDNEMSFFEMNVGMALDFFRTEKVDFAVMEVGMGGRLDSTNVVTPELSVITNISMDHQAFLGNTPALIAREKAGIIKEGVPVLIGETTPETRSVFIEIAKEKNAPISFAEEMDSPILDSDLKGAYQVKNLSTFWNSTRIVETIELSDDKILEALKSIRKLTGLRGRWDVINKDPLIITDTGHNEAAVKLLIDQMRSLGMSNWHLVWGMANDKDINSILELLPGEWKYYFCRPNVPRGLNADQLQKVASQKGLRGESFPSVQKALQEANSQCKQNEAIFIGGSSFVAAEVL
jgi:dihydrofolate synthase/folylpolyglutamate synthase